MHRSGVRIPGVAPAQLRAGEELSVRPPFDCATVSVQEPCNYITAFASDAASGSSSVISVSGSGGSFSRASSASYSR